MKFYFLLISLASLSPIIVQADELWFKKIGQELAEFDLGQLKVKSTPIEIKVFEPHEKQEIVYVAFDFVKVLEAIYGVDWAKNEEILFTCADGYQPSIPISQFKKYRSYLAFERKEGEFQLTNKQQNNEKVELGPYYLIWDNISAPELKKDEGTYWPYQVVGLDLINLQDQFPNMSPPAKANQATHRGFQLWRKYCMSCHTINGEGGDKSVELNYPSSVTEYYKEAWLKKWIDDPTSIRFNTTMPALNQQLAQRPQAIQDILAYLKTMAKNKRKPKTPSPDSN